MGGTAVCVWRNLIDGCSKLSSAAHFAAELDPWGQALLPEAAIRPSDDIPAGMLTTGPMAAANCSEAGSPANGKGEVGAGQRALAQSCWLGGRVGKADTPKPF